ncbi:MAG: hypothetical protein MMC23_000137 [Stictis urceolatum]|nr:hypothetical protein [Stictis urceolata]
MMIKTLTIFGLIASAAQSTVVHSSVQALNAREAFAGYNPTWTAVLNTNGQGTDHGVIEKRMLQATDSISYAVEGHYHIMHYYSRPSPCTIKLALPQASDGSNWGYGSPSVGHNGIEIRITKMTGTLDPDHDYIDHWVNATRGEVWKESILGTMNPLTKEWEGTNATGVCDGGDNWFLFEPVISNSLIWWQEPINYGSMGFKLTWPAWN